MAVEIITSFDQICDASGDPMSGAKIYVYNVGTTTLRDVFSDTALTPPAAANPIICDSAGRHDMRYTATGSYKIVIKTSADVAVYTRDNIDGRVPVGSGALAIANGGTSATTAAGALAALGAPTAAEVADLAAQVAAFAGAAASTEKTHVATGTTAQRPASPADGDIRRNTTIPQWEGYSGAAAAWQKLAVATEVTTEIAAALGWTLITATDAATSAVVDFTSIGATYDAYCVVISNVKPVTDDVSLNMRIGTGGGPTYQTANYQYIQSIITSGGAAVGGSSNSAASMLLTVAGGGNGIGNASGENGSFRIYFNNPDASDFMTVRTSGSYKMAGTDLAAVTVASVYNVAGAITAVRFLMSSGNISSGNFKIYGLRKS